MSTAFIRPDSKGLTGLQNALERMQLQAAERSQLLRDMAVEVKAQTQERFVSKQNPDGRSWAAWSEKYAQWRQRRHPGGGLLFCSGQLQASIDSYPLGAGRIMVGSNKEYAAAMQWGHKHTPARPYLGVSAQDAADLRSVVVDFLQRLWQRKDG